MICLDCAKENKKSTLYPGMTQTYDVYIQPYYDESGNYHYHPAGTNTEYSCSNGHRFTKTHYAKCRSCDYGDEE